MLSTLTLAILIGAPTVPVRVDGDGYLRFTREGRTVYAKETTVTVKDGVLVSKDGLPMVPRTQVNGSPEDIRFEVDGRIFGIYQGSDRLLGKTLVAVFGEDVRPVEDKGWLVSSARPTIGAPSTEGFGKIVMVKSQTVSHTKSIAPTITLRKEAEVRGSSFTLAEIANIDAPADMKARLEGLEVATTPALGVPYTLTQEMVRGRLQRYGTTGDGLVFVGEPSVTVTRKGQRVTQQMFIEAALAEAKTKSVIASAPEPQTQQPDMVVPEGALTLKVSSFDTSGSRINVRVEVQVDGKAYNARLIVLDSKASGVDLKIGQSVKLFVRSSAAVVETTGKVKSIDRATGQVTVLASTGAVMTGRAIDAGTVEVVL